MHQVAQIHNLDIVRVAMEKLNGRQMGLPGFACLYGPAGYGKSTALTTVANESRAYLIQVRSAWSRKALLENIMIEMSLASRGGKAPGTIPQMLDQVANQLAASGRPLIIDEFDHCCKADSMVELVRDIYEASQSTIIIAGEEMLPQKLKRWERFHSRVLGWIPAQPVSLADARALAPIYCNGVTVADDLLAHLVDISGGSVRRVCVNLANVAEEAAIEGWDSVTRSDWGSRPLYTGDAPRRAA